MVPDFVNRFAPGNASGSEEAFTESAASAEQEDAAK